MALREAYDMRRIRNRSEEIVFERIEGLLAEGVTVCACEECVNDLAAWALNHVIPQYYTSLLPPINPDREKEKKIRMQIEQAIASGIRRLNAHLHHG